MYQFITTTVINSRLDSNGVTPKFSASADKSIFNVTRLLSFKKDNIVSIWKQNYIEGVNEVATITLPEVAVLKGNVIRLEIDVQLVQNRADSEYASIYHKFNKMQPVECLASGDSAIDATNLVKQLNLLKDRFNTRYFKATASGAVITIEALDYFQRFVSGKVLAEDGTTTNTMIEPKYLDVTKAFAVTKHGKLGFGDDIYMMRSIMIPTAPNTNPFGTNMEERPIMGAKYSQYVIKYAVDKNLEDGIIASGKSITTHNIYVTADIDDEFNAALASVKALNGFSVILNKDNISLATVEKATLTVTTPNTVAVTMSATGIVTIVDKGGKVYEITPVAKGTVDIISTEGTTNKKIINTIRVID